jgi:hypothetical protein
MKAALGENVSLFILDDLREGGIGYVREALFERFGIEIDGPTLAPIDVTLKPNSTEGAGATRRTQLTIDERLFLNDNKDLAKALEALRAAQPLERKMWQRGPTNMVLPESQPPKALPARDHENFGID